MKEPSEYVAAVLPAGRVVCSLAEATAAVKLALVDAERYRTNLAQALIRRKPTDS